MMKRLSTFTKLIKDSIESHDVHLLRNLLECEHYLTFERTCCKKQCNELFSCAIQHDNMYAICILFEKGFDYLVDVHEVEDITELEKNPSILSLMMSQGIQYIHVQGAVCDGCAGYDPSSILSLCMSHLSYDLIRFMIRNNKENTIMSDFTIFVRSNQYSQRRALNISRIIEEEKFQVE